MTKLISSQRFLDEEIISQKQANEDYVLTITNTFEYDGEELAIITDGHHAMEAAKRNGQEPEIVIEEQYNSILDSQGPEALLELCKNESEYYDVATGINLW